MAAATVIAPARFDVFLSHSSRDKTAVELLGRRLRDEAQLNPFFDLWHLTPGKPWQPELEQAIERSACAAVFLGPDSESPWRDQEMQVALNRAVRTHDDYRVIPVLLPGADPGKAGGFLQLRTWVDFRSGLDDPEAFARLVAGIRGEPAETGSYALPDEPAPYRGLLPFQKEHAAFFFGREPEKGRVIEKLSRSSFVAIVGASGSGKSSVARAGLLPALEGDAIAESAKWTKRIVLPGADPLRALADQLSTLTDGSSRQRVADELVARFQNDSSGLRTCVSNLLAETGSSLFLLIDQFEELFTHGSAGTYAPGTTQFIDNLCDAAFNGRGQTRIAITLRADFVGHCLEFPALAKLLEDNQILIGSLGDESLREAVIMPAQKVGAFLEQGLVQIILRDVAGQPGALPLLQHALHELWLLRRGPWLTVDSYEKSGGVNGALERRAEAAYRGLSSQEQRIARNLFLRLTAVEEGARETRRRSTREELYPADVDSGLVDGVIRTLSAFETRLIVADEDTVEIAHEALLRRWGTLRRWIDEAGEAFRIHRRLTNHTAEWERDDRHRSGLYAADQLVELRRWWPSLEEGLSKPEKDFVRASWDGQMQNARRQVFGGMIVLAVGLSINALLAGMAFSEGVGVALINLVPIPLGFGLGGFVAQRITGSPVREYIAAIAGAVLIQLTLLAFFALIWPQL